MPTQEGTGSVLGGTVAHSMSRLAAQNRVLAARIAELERRIRQAPFLQSPTTSIGYVPTSSLIVSVIPTMQQAATTPPKKSADALDLSTATYDDVAPSSNGTSSQIATASALNLTAGTWTAVTSFSLTPAQGSDVIHAGVTGSITLGAPSNIHFSIGLTSTLPPGGTIVSAFNLVPTTEGFFSGYAHFAIAGTQTLFLSAKAVGANATVTLTYHVTDVTR